MIEIYIKGNYLVRDKFEVVLRQYNLNYKIITQINLEKDEILGYYLQFEYEEDAVMFRMAWDD